MIMIAETISLGILSLPSVLAAIGFVPYVGPFPHPQSLLLSILNRPSCSRG